MTAVMAIQLYEQGLLNLDEPIKNYFKDWPDKHFEQHKVSFKTIVVLI